MKSVRESTWMEDRSVQRSASYYRHVELQKAKQTLAALRRGGKRPGLALRLRLALVEIGGEWVMPSWRENELRSYGSRPCLAPRCLYPEAQPDDYVRPRSRAGRPRRDAIPEAPPGDTAGHMPLPLETVE